MRFNEFLKDKLISIVVETIAIGFVAILLSVLNIGLYAVGFITVILVLAFVASIIVEYARKKPFYKMVTESVDKIDQKYLVFELIDEPGFAEGQALYYTLGKATKAMNDQLAIYQNASSDYREYIETWVHEIKTPIAAVKLITENNRDTISKHIDDELMKIDAFVEQALFYSKSNTVEKDYIIREVSLSDCVKDAIKKHSRALIECKVAIEMNDLDQVVFTDSKWIDFILGQLITNAIKYKKDSVKLSFSALSLSNSTVLIIEDNGIGIPEKDVNRVFNKGFTGENGRSYAKSTGIGLYLCKKLCNKMGLSIQLASEQGEGTKISIVFPKSKRELLEN